MMETSYKPLNDSEENEKMMEISYKPLNDSEKNEISLDIPKDSQELLIESSS